MFPSPTFAALYELFPDLHDVPQAVPVEPEAIPEPYKSLLVHEHHMTVTVEEFYGDRVDVRVLDSSMTGAEEYSRRILLSLHESGKVVQFGVVQIDLSLLSPLVREQILEQKTPLGRVLIQNNVFRDVRPTGFLKVVPNRTMCEWFHLDRPVTTYGRLGVISCDGKPAIEVLEVLTPVQG